MPERQKGSQKLSLFPGVAAFLAFFACNGSVVLVTIFSLFGVTIVINPHIQAATISLFALLTLGFVFLIYIRHRDIRPVFLAGVGAALVVGTMYIAFSKAVETFGLLVLIASAIWSWRVSRGSGSAQG